MHTVMWKFTLPADARKEQLDQIISGSAPGYVGIPGLIRKYYGYRLGQEGNELVGIYLWQSEAQADAFYTPEWVAKVSSRWGATPQRQEWDTPSVVESALGGVIGR